MAKKEINHTKERNTPTGKSKKNPTKLISKSAVIKKVNNKPFDSFPLNILKEIGDYYSWEAEAYPLKNTLYSENILNVTGYKNDDAAVLPNGHFHLICCMMKKNL